MIITCDLKDIFSFAWQAIGWPKKTERKKKETKLPAITHGPEELSVSSKILKPITNLWHQKPQSSKAFFMRNPHKYKSAKKNLQS